MNHTSAGALSQEAADRQGGEVWYGEGVSLALLIRTSDSSYIIFNGGYSA